MGLYNFQPRFEAPIMAGTKTHTIRAERVHRDKPGATMHLYVGLRHPGARCLMRAVCSKVEQIRITETPLIFIDETPLDCSEAEQLARRDGFADFEEMMSFWEGRLPFKGHIYHWRKP